MKKLLIASCMMLGFSAFVSAQTATPKSKAAPAKATTVSKPAATTTTPVAKSTPSKPLKADGTPDMRYKENKKTAAPVTGPKKADGTPDMRYKANKTTKGKS